ncbi:MAG TPA: cytochrome c1 [Burkholderiales bacterium]|nr:cytochrome c1 [Burkholderiales bacterium]
MVKNLLLALALVPLMAFSAEEGKLDTAPVNSYDNISLQRGARTFVNYCLTCHNAMYMRYKRLEDLGLTDQQIKDNLMFAVAKRVGDTMTVAMDKNDAKDWFGTTPPDLSVIARARGADWLYTYLRSFYRDDTTHTGWNNTVFPRVGMPNVLHELQGTQVLKTEVETDAQGHKHEVQKLVLESPGTLTPVEYDMMVADLVNYLVFMAEPEKTFRITLGIYVLFFLAIAFVLTYMLKLEFWKDVH